MTVRLKNSFLALALLSTTIEASEHLNLLRAAHQADDEALSRALDAGAFVDARIIWPQAYFNEPHFRYFAVNGVTGGARKIGCIILVQDTIEIQCGGETESLVNLEATSDTALIRASAKGYAWIVEILLKAGAQATLQGDFLMTPLMRACEHGHIQIVKLLIESPQSSAALNLQNWRGYSALMLASQMGHLEIVHLLIDEGAKIDLKAHDGISNALILASRARHQAIVKLLLEVRDFLEDPESWLDSAPPGKRERYLKWAAAYKWLL